MSNVSTIFDRILVVLASTYSTRIRLINSYDLEDNPDQILLAGYGLKVGPASPVEMEFHRKAVEQVFTVVLTDEVLKIDGDQVSVDSIVKSQLEAINTGQKLFYNADQIQIESSIEDVDLGPVSAVTYFKGEKTNFISMEFDITITIGEDL